MLIPFLLILFFCPLEKTANAATSVKSTLSSGYYRDIEQKSHIPAYFYWDVQHSTPQGIETQIHIGVNNAIVEDSWKFFLYHATLTIPLKEGFEEAPFRKSQLLLGRQLFFEGFELSLLDGVQSSLYWTPSGGATFSAGALNTVLRRRFNFDSQIYGGTLHQHFWGALWKAGYFYHVKDNIDNGHLTQFSFLKTWDFLPFEPMIFLKGQMDLPKFSLDQRLAELQLVPLEAFILNTGYSQLKPNAFAPEDGNFIYQLLSTTAQKTLRASLTWAPTRLFQAESQYRYLWFNSNGGHEVAHHGEASLSLALERINLKTSAGYLASYGGTVTHGGFGANNPLITNVTFRSDMDIAWIDKINHISGWAYHGRMGLDYRLTKRFLITALAEIERNHLFEIGTRAILYVSHIYF